MFIPDLSCLCSRGVVRRSGQEEGAVLLRKLHKVKLNGSPAAPRHVHKQKGETL